MKVAGDSPGSWSTGGVESIAADHAQLSRRQRCQSVQNAVHKRPQMNHAVRRRSNDHDAQSKGTPILLVLKTSIHTQQDIETLLGTPKQLPVRRPRPACGLHGADLMSRQFGGESTWQILVKQNAQGPKRNPEPDRARQPPVASRPTGTDRGTGRGSLPLPDSRTAPEPAPACRGKPAYPPRFPGRCGRPTAHQPCDHHTPLDPAVAHAGTHASRCTIRPRREATTSGSTGDLVGGLDAAVATPRPVAGGEERCSGPPPRTPGVCPRPSLARRRKWSIPTPAATPSTGLAAEGGCRPSLHAVRLPASGAGHRRSRPSSHLPPGSEIPIYGGCRCRPPPPDLSAKRTALSPAACRP